MKKKLVVSLALLLMGVFLGGGNARALPYEDGGLLPNTSGYTWVDTSYWYCTDLTTAENGTALFELKLENAAYESDFGLFTVDNVVNPMTIVAHHKIFDYSDEEDAQQAVYFKTTGGGTTWEVSNDNSNWLPFDRIFGFYYAVHTGSNTVPDWIYYSDPSFNTENTGEQHVAMEWDGISMMRIYLDDQNDNPDWDWNDMTVYVSDIAPIPEPATMLLLGVGLIGLAAVGRKRFL